jgi:hypothetical protein
MRKYNNVKTRSIYNNLFTTSGMALGLKKIPVVPVSYLEKIRVGRSEINIFKNIFSWFWRFFAG